jgi:hypothetical protein
LVLGSSILDLPCHNCATPFAISAAACPHCGAPRHSHAAGYEWKSASEWLGYPLIDVAFGCDADGKPLVARGLVAIGARAVGGIAIGIVAGGGIAVGIVSAGLCSIGVVSVAVIAALGVNAVAPLAFGVVAVGFIGGGVHFIGWKLLFSLTQPTP